MLGQSEISPAILSPDSCPKNSKISSGDSERRHRARQIIAAGQKSHFQFIDIVCLKFVEIVLLGAGVLPRLFRHDDRALQRVFPAVSAPRRLANTHETANDPEGDANEYVSYNATSHSITAPGYRVVLPSSSSCRPGRKPPPRAAAAGPPVHSFRVSQLSDQVGDPSPWDSSHPPYYLCVPPH